MKVKRYEAMHRDVWDDESGKFVRYEDYAEIQRQLTAYEATVTDLTAQVQGLAAENDLILGLAPRYELLPEKHPDWDRAYRIGWNAHQGALEAMRDKMEAPITDAALAEIRNEARAEGINYAAGRLAAAFNNGFIDKPLAEVFDVTRMILTAKEDIANEPAADGLSGEYAETALKEWADKLRKEQGK